MLISQAPLVGTFVAYVVVILAIAYYATKLTSNLSDYVLAGRRLSGPITALSAGAADMSSWLLMALPGMVYVYGCSMLWMPVALSIGAYCNWTLVAKRLRIYTEVAKDSLTVPEFLSNRFHEKGNSLHIIASIVTVIFFTYYSVAGFVSGAILLQSSFDMSYEMALYITAAVIVIYTGLGGLLAVSWVDFFQGMLMFTALLVVPFGTYLQFSDVNVFDKIAQYSNTHLQVLDNVTILGMISMFAWGLGYFGQLHINTRFMAIRSAKEIPIARFICMNWMVLSLAGAIFTGLFGFAYYLENPLRIPDTVFIKLSQQLFNPWVAGILLSAVLSAIMSTVAAQLLMSSSILVEDFYSKMIRKNASNNEYLMVSRLLLVVIAGVGVFISSDPNQTIFQSVGFAWSGLGASFGPILLFSLFWKRMTKQAAIAGIITGAAVVISWKYFAPEHPDLLSGFELLPAFVLSSIAIIIVSKLSPKPNQQVLDDFQRTITKLT